MELSSLWEGLLAAMRTRIGSQDVDVWLKAATPVHLDDEVMLLEVANRYYADWITDNYLDALRDEARSALGRAVELKFTWRDEPTAEEPIPLSDADLEREPRGLGVNLTQTFESFVIGECNKFAHAAACAVADHPARNYNPLFIYGSTGLGKTHLMHAIANRVLGTEDQARVVYVTAEDFMNEMINCLRYKRMDDFRAKYRKRASVLLVDDVQFLSGKERTQEEFFHTFNALQTSGRQIVLTSDVIPRDIDKLEPRLRTRFEGGLLADMQAPDKETLLAILRQKADAQRLHIPADLADAIAAIVAGNIRELEGLLNRLSALHSFYDHEPITIDWARKRLPGVFDPAPVTVTVAGIIEAVAKFHNLRSADITGNKRTRTLTRPRHIAMYLARVHTNRSFPELGREFGDRDHSTIQHGYRKVREELEADPDLAYKVRLIEQGLQIRA
ncbi:MAG: chromosomal replication initiator protein DnaA [Myxococcota bacterium]